MSLTAAFSLALLVTAVGLVMLVQHARALGAVVLLAGLTCSAGLWWESQTDQPAAAIAPTPTPEKNSFVLTVKLVAGTTAEGVDERVTAWGDLPGVRAARGEGTTVWVGDSPTATVLEMDTVTTRIDDDPAVVGVTRTR
jgi:hypothetical protein